MKKIVLLSLVLILVAVPAAAQKKENEIKRPDGYNYTRGVEEAQNENYYDAIQYFSKEISDNPKNGYAYCWMACVYLQQEELGYAMSASDNAIKYLPKKDKEYQAVTYRNRAEIYLALADTLQALADYTTAIEFAPDDTRAYKQRGDLYYSLKEYDKSIADYQQIIALDKGMATGYMGLGRTYNAQERWQEAIEQFSKVIALYSDYSSGYSFRASAYIGLEDWQHATDDIITALSLDQDIRTFYIMQDLPQEGTDQLCVKLAIQCEKNPNDANWPYCAGTIYEQNKQYAKAIKYYRESNRRNADDTALERVSFCYDDLGDFQQALTYIDKAIQLDPNDISYSVQRSYILINLGRYDEALAEAEKYLQKYPDYAYSYIWRSDVKALLHDYDGAIDDLTTAIILDPENALAYDQRGDFYTQLGETALAAEDYKKVIELEDAPEKYEYSMFAYQALGDDDQALAVMDTIINRSDDLQGDYYNAACLYSRMHNKDKALEYLTKAFDEGYNCFQHISADYDMDFLRADDDFKSLVDKYYQQHKESLTHDVEEAEEGEEVTTEIPFTKEHSMCHVECTINALPLYFVFDTGASAISLSKVEADFMFKNGYLTEKDIVGSGYFSTATGSVSIGTIINLRQVEFAGLVLDNVQASVVSNQRAPLLLGQSVLGRLGKIEIDNDALLLRITHKAVNP